MTTPAYELAERCLMAVAAWYDDAVEHPDLELPARRYVCIGLPAADCEQLAVSIEAITPINTSAGAGTAVGSDQDEIAFYMRAVNLGLWLMRCVPGLDDQANPPDAEAESAAAELISDDQQQMEMAIHAAYTDGELPGCGGIAFVEWQSITPEGYIGGGVLRLILSME